MKNYTYGPPGTCFKVKEKNITEENNIFIITEDENKKKTVSYIDKDGQQTASFEVKLSQSFFVDDDFIINDINLKSFFFDKDKIYDNIPTSSSLKIFYKDEWDINQEEYKKIIIPYIKEDFRKEI